MAPNGKGGRRLFKRSDPLNRGTVSGARTLGEREMDRLDRAMQALPAAVADDADLLRLGRWCTVDCLLGIGEVDYHLGIERGRVRSLVRGPLRMRAWTFAVRAERDAWMRFWSPLPEPGYNDIFAMSSRGHARIDGDIGPLLEHLRYLKAIIALPGRLLAENAA